MRQTLWAGVIGLATATGCSETKSPVGNEQSAIETAPAEPTPALAPAMPDRNQSFEQATTAAPVTAVAPPDQTRAGMPTAALSLAVRKVWDGIKLDTGDPVRVVFATDAGDVEVTLFPDLAPNHVRNLLALSQLGYYDGLVFERIVRQEAVTADGTPSAIEFLTVGCPAGTGNPGQGHLGYFLRPEFSTLTHEDGTVGFWHESEDGASGTRLYITLGPCPAMDGRFTVVGKVSRGLDVLHQIAKSPTQEPDYERPMVPAVVQQARPGN